MANLKAIRRRIGSVKSTQKITRAMKMVAAARLRRAQQAALRSRPFADSAARMLASMQGQLGELEHPLLTKREVKRVHYLVIASDRGLAGAYNNNVAKAIANAIRDGRRDALELSFTALGRRAETAVKRFGAELSEGLSLNDFQKRFAEDCESLRASLEKRFREAAYDEVRVIFTHFRSAITQEIRVQSLLPIQANTTSGHEDLREILFEPSADAILEELVPLVLLANLQSAIRDAVASEHSARMTAMDAATNNASDMIDRLTLEYNRARQAAITTELVEIISGAQAIEG